MEQQGGEKKKGRRSWGPLTIKWEVSSDPQKVLVKFLLDDELVDVSELNASQPDYSFDVCLGNSKACGRVYVQFPTSDTSDVEVGKLSGQFQCCSRKSSNQAWKCECYQGIITWWK